MDLHSLKKQSYVLFCGLVGIITCFLLQQSVQDIHYYLLDYYPGKFDLGLTQQFWSLWWLAWTFFSVFGGFAFGVSIGEEWFLLLAQDDFPVFYTFVGKLLRPHYLHNANSAYVLPDQFDLTTGDAYVFEENKRTVVLPDGHVFFTDTFAADLHIPVQGYAGHSVRHSVVSRPGQPKKTVKRTGTARSGTLAIRKASTPKRKPIS